MQEKTGKYAVFVTSVSGQTEMFGRWVDRYEHAVRLQQNALSPEVGRAKAAIFDSSLTEVKEKPKEKEIKAR